VAYKRLYQIRLGVVAAILIAGSLMYAALPVLALRWAETPYAGMFFDPHLVINKTTSQFQPLDPPEARSSYPDRVTAVDQTPINNVQELNDLLANHQPGDALTFTLEQPPAGSRIAPREGETAVRQITLILSYIDETTLWREFWLFYLVGLVILLIGILTFLARPESEAAQSLALFAICTATIIGALFDQITTQVFVRFWAIALAMAGGPTILLTLIFPHEARLVSRFPWMKWAVFLPGLALTILGQVWLYHGPDEWTYALAWRYAYVWLIISLLITVGIMGYRSFASPSPLVRQQARLILLGAVFGMGPIIVALIWLAASLGWERFNPAIFFPPVILFPLSIAYTIVRYRLIDVNRLLRRGLTAVLLAAMLAGAFLLIVSGLAVAVGINITFNNPGVVILFLLIVLLAYDPLRDWLQRWLDRLLFQKPVELGELLREYNRGLTTAVTTTQVAETLTTYVQRAIPMHPPKLFLYDNNLGGYAPFPEANGDLVTNESPLVQYMRQKTEILDLSVERAWPAELQQNPNEIARQGAAIIVPLNNQNELLGWLSLPQKANEQRYSQSDLNYLGALADQSLIALERTSVIRRLEARVAELDQLSQFSQALNFTIDEDVLLELVFTNYQRLLRSGNFFVALQDRATGQLYPAFFVEQGERLTEQEGRQLTLTDAQVRQAMMTGQNVESVDENGRSWWYAPLNAGADTLGVLYTYWPEGMQPAGRQRQLFTMFADRTAVALDRLQTRQELAERAQKLEIINEVTLSLASTLALEPLLNLIMDKAMELLDTEAGTFMMAVEDTGELEFRVVRGPASGELLGKRLPLGAGLAGTAAQTGRPVRQNRVQDDKRWFGDLDPKTKFVSESILTVPLLRGNIVLGVIQVINKQNGAPFNDEDETMLSAFAGQAVVALENARLLAQTDQALQYRVNELFTLQQLDRDLNTTLDLEHVLRLTLDWALRVSGGAAGKIMLADEEGQPHLQAQRNYENEFSVIHVNGHFTDDGLISQVMGSGEAHLSGNVHAESQYRANNAYTTLSQMTLPIVHKQKRIGVATIESDRLNCFSGDDLETAVRLTNHAAVAIANALLYQQVTAANQAKSEFVSMVSHELKTPMTSMRGYTDLMLSGMTGDLTAQQRSFLETIAANIRRMSQQIQDLTDVSRIETGQLHINLAPTAFSNVISETLQSVRSLSEEKNIELQLNLPADLPLVIADKERLVQVLTNLLSNACKYSPPNTSVQVNLKSDSLPLGDGDELTPTVVCSVQDQGYGISLEDQKKLFTKFFRAEDPNIRKATGTGLGLSITKGIVELHGGQLWVESQLGEGARFTFTIPQAPI
jgi:signal transduction histidine kinase